MQINMNLHQKTPDQLSRIFLALAHPTRRKIIFLLTDGDASVSRLAKPFEKEISLVAVSKHLKILERAGLITRSRDKQLRLSHLQVRPLEEAFSWIENYRQFWDESLDKLEEAIEEEKLKQKEKNYESTNNN